MAAVIAAIVVFALVLVLGTLVVQRRAAARIIELDRELTTTEALTGRCGACDGQGFRWGRARQMRTCWRCDGTGSPPTAEDRIRFMPSVGP